jgi:hypothetical protein
LALNQLIQIPNALVRLRYNNYLSKKGRVTTLKNGRVTTPYTKKKVVSILMDQSTIHITVTILTNSESQS